MSEAFIIDGVRTAIGNYGGTLSAVRADDLAAHVIKALLARNTSVDPAAIEDVILGCANQAGEDNRNVARMALLLAGVPWSVPGETVNRLCASGLNAVINASRGIKLGDGDFYIAGGVENMSRAPYVLNKQDKAFGRAPEIYDTSIGWRFINSKMQSEFGTDSMGETAENVVERFGLSREDQDQFAANSQGKATAARESGRFAREIVAVEIPQRKKEAIVFDQDEFIRPQTTTEVLAKLRPAFRKEGSVTAGNSSGVNDGAAALLLASAAGVEKANLKPKAKIIATACAGVEPRVMGIGPVEASRKALQRAGISTEELGVIELNEAFAAQSLACIRELGLKDDDPRINPNGGAIALGHPLGMSGARLALTAMHELEERNERYALCTLCVGVGQGVAAVLERIT